MGTKIIVKFSKPMSPQQMAEIVEKFNSVSEVKIHTFEPVEEVVHSGGSTHEGDE